MDLLSALLDSVRDAASARNPVGLLLAMVTVLVPAIGMLVRTWKRNRELETEAEALRVMMQGLQDRTHRLTGELQECRSEETNLRSDLSNTKSLLSIEREKCQDSIEKLALADHQLIYSKRKIENFEVLVKRHHNEAAELSERAEELRILANGAKWEVSALRSDLKNARARVADLEGNLSAGVGDLRREVDDLRTRNARLTARLDEAHDELANVEGERQVERSKRRALESEVGRADSDKVAALEESLDDYKARLKQSDSGRSVIDQVLHDLRLSQGDIWRKKPVLRPPFYSERLKHSKPIMMIANLKGGVGKTTLAANLAAHYHEHDERVLLIDFDYQGSLSAMVIDENRPDKQSNSVKLFRDESFETYCLKSREASRVLDCRYDFADEETTLMLEWLAGRTAGDVRFTLAEYLLGEEIQLRFDRIIIDTAPRVSVGFINAFCAATHLLIPTRLDTLSAETVGSFLRVKHALMMLRSDGQGEKQLQEEGTSLPFQVIGTMKRYDTDKLSGGEADAIAVVNQSIEAYNEDSDIFLTKAFIPARVGFSNDAGFDIAYFNDPEVRMVIDRVGREIGRVVPAKWSLAA